MQCCTMTFRRAIGFSIAVHVALFGTALAFAHYGGSFLPGEARVIMVSLHGRDGAGLAAHRNAAPPRPEILHEPAMVQEEPPQQDEQTSTEMEDTAPVEEGQIGTAGEGTGSASAAAAGFGYTPEEWGLLQSALEKAKTYPRFARERGIEGTVLVRFKVRPEGGIERVDIVKSSGAKILDEASVRTIYRAAPVPYVDGWVEVPMVYRLQSGKGQ
jgi:TonB family protein